jgi:hypothetical protein|tara:strand:+ start:252 stop:923 length:672 start_codon:yes stop_codon:yes gene_type:complete
MKISFIKKYTLIIKLILKNFSPLRIYQILEIKKISIEGDSMDLGATNSPNNITNFFYKNNGKIIYFDKFKKDKDVIQIDLEKYPNLVEKQFKNVFLMNVLEHIKEYKNCLRNVHSLLGKNSNFYGTTPFHFRIHPSPNDYFRFTGQLIEENLIEIGFKEVKVIALGTGIFVCFYTMIYLFTKKIPFINLFLFFICLFIDKIIEYIKPDIKKIYPLGYFFSAKK